MIEGLYDLIGGRSTIKAATKLFYDKMQDDSLRHFFEGVDMAHIRSRQEAPTHFCTRVPEVSAPNWRLELK